MRLAVEIYGPERSLTRIKHPPVQSLLSPPTVVFLAVELYGPGHAHPERRPITKSVLQPPTVVFLAVEIYGPEVHLTRIKPQPTVSVLRPPVVVTPSWRRSSTGRRSTSPTRAGWLRAASCSPRSGGRRPGQPRAQSQAHLRAQGVREEPAAATRRVHAWWRSQSTPGLQVTLTAGSGRGARSRCCSRRAVIRPGRCLRWSGSPPHPLEQRAGPRASCASPSWSRPSWSCTSGRPPRSRTLAGDARSRSSVPRGWLPQHLPARRSCRRG